MGSSVRKRVTQAGLSLFVVQDLELGLGYFVFTIPEQFSLGIFVPINSGIFLLLGASALPAGDNGSWGSTWPLVGHDKAVFAWEP